MMPLYKFNSFEEAQKAQWCYNPDRAYYEKVARLFELANRLSPLPCKQGVHFFKSIEEAGLERNDSE